MNRRYVWKGLALFAATWLGAVQGLYLTWQQTATEDPAPWVLFAIFGLYPALIGVVQYLDKTPQTEAGEVAQTVAMADDVNPVIEPDVV